MHLAWMISVDNLIKTLPLKNSKWAESSTYLTLDCQKTYEKPNHVWRAYLILTIFHYTPCASFYSAKNLHTELIHLYELSIAIWHRYDAGIPWETGWFVF